MYVVKSEKFSYYSLYRYFVKGGTNVTITTNGLTFSSKSDKITSGTISVPFILLRLFVEHTNIHYEVNGNLLYITISYEHSYDTLLYFLVVLVFSLIIIGIFMSEETLPLNARTSIGAIFFAVALLITYGVGILYSYLIERFSETLYGFIGGFMLLITLIGCIYVITRDLFAEKEE